MLDNLIKDAEEWIKDAENDLIGLMLIITEVRNMHIH